MVDSKKRSDSDLEKDMAAGLEAAEEPGISPEDAEDLLRALGLVFTNVPLYGLKHKVTVKTMEDCYRLFNVALDVLGEVSFQLMEDTLVINTTHVDRRNPLAHAFAKHLADRELSNFSMARGLTFEMFGELMEILNAKPDDLKRLGGVASVLKESGLQNVKAANVVYKRVADDEVVISKDQAGSGMASVGNIQSVLSFLRGGTDLPATPETVKAMRQMAATDAPKMGEAIVEAAQAKRDEEKDATLTEMVVDSLKRVYEQLSKDPAVRTQKGKKELTRALGALEEQVKERILAMAGELSDADARAITDTVEGMTDELKIDALVAEYMKKRSAIDENEQRLLRFMKSKGLDRLSESELEQRLLANGLTPDGWRELLAKSGIDVGPGAAGSTMVGGIPVVGHLAELLSTIQGSVSGVRRDGEAGAVRDVKVMLVEIDEEVKSMVARAQVKIRHLVSATQADTGVMEEIERRVVLEKGQGLQMPRRKLLQTLAEIAQELCQPLAVVSCSIDMITSKSLGDVTESQVNVLRLATESVQRLKVLTDHLMMVSGLPVSMSPDIGIQKAIYGGS